MIISVIGSGGKTTKIKQLKDQYLKEGKTVLMTTSTHMKIEENTLVDPSYEEIINEIKKRGYVHAGSKAKNQKIKALDDEVLERLKKEIDVILIEADGSHGLPLKYPRNHEPVVDKDSNEIILITSLKGLGKPVQDVVHGYQEMKVDGKSINSTDPDIQISKIQTTDTFNIDKSHPDFHYLNGGWMLED